MKKGDFTRNKIVEAAAELFNLYGYEGVSLNDIMLATNLKKGGIYNHFSNKEEIARASFDYTHDLIFKRFREKLDLCQTSIEKIYAVIETFADLVNRPVIKGGCPIMNTVSDSSDKHLFIKDKAKESVLMLQKYVEIKIEEAKVDGYLPQSISASQYAAFLIATMEGAQLLAYNLEDLSFVESCRQNLLLSINQLITKE